MSDTLHIDRLSTRIRSADGDEAQALAGQVRQLADLQLARAMEGSGTRALVRAGLPAGSVVAVRRVDLMLRLSATASAGELATGWAAALEAALARLLAGLAPGDADQDAPAVWFPDAWAAERRHLERRLAGQEEAWWAAELAGDDDSALADPLAPLAILLRWLRRDPARAVADMGGLARADIRVIELLDPAGATTLTRALLDRLARPALPDALPRDEASAMAQADPQPLRDRLEALLARHPHLAVTDGGGRSRPWLAALLLATHPSMSRLTATGLGRLLAQINPAPRPAAEDTPGETTAESPRNPDPRALLHTHDDAPLSHPVMAGGLLLLLRPLQRLDLLPPPERLGAALADLALTLLRRIFAPLPTGERRVAEERERPLLAVLAPERDWREPIAGLAVADPAAALALLERLSAAIPAKVAPAPGALRQVFGAHLPAFATEGERRLAQLVLRPGQLRVSPWEAELTWPLAAIDLALRRAGWDQDPGWLPWLGRSIRFRFGSEA